MTGQFVLIVSDDNDGSRGQVAVLDTTEETERKIAALLTEGFDPNLVRVFTGGRTGVKVTHRPVVRLVKRNSDVGSGSTTHPEGQVEPELAPAVVDSYKDHSATAVSFSHLFKPAYQLSPGVG
jgi:hypothetical protein